MQSGKTAVNRGRDAYDTGADIYTCIGAAFSSHPSDSHRHRPITFAEQVDHQRRSSTSILLILLIPLIPLSSQELNSDFPRISRLASLPSPSLGCEVQELRSTSPITIPGRDFALGPTPTTPADCSHGLLIIFATSPPTSLDRQLTPPRGFISENILRFYQEAKAVSVSPPPAAAINSPGGGHCFLFAANPFNSASLTALLTTANFPGQPHPYDSTRI
ncbi:hypothetical protein HYALB_00002748 [Hymenoscyphus albidus]|uniref:Uncharacterized protein n=1 Tax=Hymenoscyphus albidus TaxID=595503 RepID=A0A9N9PT17_9HELO|nr:hypothetical protein HYALB_00002748 [Hymenoscyphus albidus]